jgi:hypothetical protein
MNKRIHPPCRPIYRDRLNHRSQSQSQACEDAHRQARPTCPHCMHEMSTDEMVDHEVDLFGMAVDESAAEIDCPSCAEPYWVRGGYTPHYSSSTTADGI